MENKAEKTKEKPLREAQQTERVDAIVGDANKIVRSLPRLFGENAALVVKKKRDHLYSVWRKESDIHILDRKVYLGDQPPSEASKIEEHNITRIPIEGKKNGKARTTGYVVLTYCVFPQKAPESREFYEVRIEQVKLSFKNSPIWKTVKTSRANKVRPFDVMSDLSWKYRNCGL